MRQTKEENGFLELKNIIWINELFAALRPADEAKEQKQYWMFDK